MPELCRFYNIIIYMLYNDTQQHHKPHFHVRYGEFKAAVSVDGELLAGFLPIKQMRLVLAWATIHEDELIETWEKAVNGIPFGKIDPLK